MTYYNPQASREWWAQRWLDLLILSLQKRLERAQLCSSGKRPQYQVSRLKVLARCKARNQNRIKFPYPLTRLAMSSGVM